MAHRLSLGTVLKRDWPSFGLAVFLGFIWLFAIVAYLAAGVWYPRDEEAKVLARILGVCTLAITALCGSVIVWRIHVIRSVFARGEVVRGQILRVGQNSEDIGDAVITYQYQGREYLVRNVTEGAGDRRELTAGDPVDVVIDPSNPSRAFIADLYLG